LRRFGLDLVRYDAAHIPALRHAELARAYDVNLVLDVGANDGAFGRALRAAGYRGRIVSFEPQQVAFAELERAATALPPWTSKRVALGAAVGDAELHVAGNSSSSSLLPMTGRHVASSPESRVIGTERVPVTTLDELRAELVGADDRIYLKVDVQGFELEVLRGAETTLQGVALLCAELSFEALYEGAPVYSDVIDHLAERGFALLAIDPVFVDPKDGRLLQVDAFFGRVAT
jgi:FkbM family methyltransferase